MLDWSDGKYEPTGEELAPVAQVVLDRAELESGENVLDLGCGTGNFALLAARTGANVTAMDPAGRLLEVTGARAEAEGLCIACVGGHGAATGAESGAFDLVAAVFSVIFAPEPDPVAAEMLRVTRPGGRIVLTSWVAEGPIADAAEHLFVDVHRANNPWTTLEGLRSLFDRPSTTLDIQEHTLPFRAASAQAWLADVEAHHPVWRAAKQLAPGDWDERMARMLEALERGSESKTEFLTHSKYRVVRVDVAG